MSNIIAGDPAPTNPTARTDWDAVGVTNRLILGILAGAERKPLFDAYRAQVRAEVMAEAIAAARSEYRLDDDSLNGDLTYNNGVSGALGAIIRLTEGGDQS
jgi:hypothetical protein